MTPQKIVLITGAARGIGAATAQLFARKGYAVCINYRSHSEAAQSIQNSIVHHGGHCLLVQSDVSTEEGVQALFETVDRQLGTVDVLVNNAAILKHQSRLEALAAERINAIFANNVTGYFLCAREAIKRMSINHGGQGGVIINVSSVAARTGSPNEYIDYAATKGAIDTMTIGLAREVAGEEIRVNGVRPGLIYTDMHADGGEPDRVSRLARMVPMQRGGEPKEVAEAIYWLSSEKASFSTGQIIDIAGGL